MLHDRSTFSFSQIYTIPKGMAMMCPTMPIHLRLLLYNCGSPNFLYYFLLPASEFHTLMHGPFQKWTYHDRTSQVPTCMSSNEIWKTPRHLSEYTFFESACSDTYTD